MSHKKGNSLITKPRARLRPHKSCTVAKSGGSCHVVSQGLNRRASQPDGANKNARPIATAAWGAAKIGTSNGVAKGFNLFKSEGLCELLCTQAQPNNANIKATLVDRKPLTRLSRTLVARPGSSNNCCHASKLKLCLPRAGKMPKAAQVVSPRPATTGINMPITRMASIAHFGQFLKNIMGYINTCFAAFIARYVTA